MIFVLALLLQWNSNYELLVIEDARGDAKALVEALQTGDADVKRQAIRALGRFERAELAEHVVPFLDARMAETRVEAVGALAQMKADAPPLGDRLEKERVPAVRAALYEALGRIPTTKQEQLVAGLGEDELARTGAVKGLEHLLRTGERPATPATVLALRKAVADSRSAKIRELALLALNRGGDRDTDILEIAWRDPSPLVRRLAVLGLEEWRDDPSPIVRYAGLKAAPTCERAQAALDDPSEHVALLAIDLLGKHCSSIPASLLERDWRSASRTLVSLARVRPTEAKAHLPCFASHDVWQARVYTARAARILEDDRTLEKLRADRHPNVVAAALVTPAHALAALASDHYGLLVRALGLLEGGVTRGDIPTLLAALKRVTNQGRATSRDPRRLMLERLGELGVANELEFLLSDFDPFIAELAASIMGKNGETAASKTTRFAPTPAPSEAFFQKLAGAKARIRMKEAGSFVLVLLPEAAPFTVAQFVKLAEAGYYDGLTFHRIAPNFVLQGGSPGANEFVGTDGYIRDEVGRLSHERGTLGISTRGRDTGDSQLFINLVDNYRLDHNYTVFARVVEGLDNVDKVQEGDVMLSVTIER